MNIFSDIKKIMNILLKIYVIIINNSKSKYKQKSRVNQST